MTYYHLSEKNCNNKVFRPRVPKDAYVDGDIKTKRICVSTAIIGAARAIIPVYWPHYAFEYYVHIPINNNKVIKPKESQVYDVHNTRERWLMENTAMKCIGKIKVTCGFNEKISFKWIEKYG